MIKLNMSVSRMRLKTVFVFFMLIGCFQLVNADDPLLFYADFDNGVNARFAKGDKAAKYSIAPEFMDGLKGKALVVGRKFNSKETNRIYNYDAKDNIDFSTGTISFWMKPLDWNGDNEYFNVLFRTGAGSNYFMIYKFFNGDMFLFLYGPQSKWSQGRTSAKNWKPLQWHHIVCTWSDKEVRLYLDGKLQACQKIVTPINGFAPQLPLSLGPGGWEDSSQGLTLLDELKIYGKVLLPMEIGKLYEEYYKAAGIRNDSNFVTIGKRTPVLDGKINHGEYSFSGTGFCDTNGTIAKVQSKYFLSYDKDNLYVAVKKPMIPDKKADEKIDIFLSNQNDANKIFNFSFTPTQSINGLPAKSAVENDLWTFETSIPFSSVGMSTPENGQEFRINIGTSSGKNKITSLSPVVTSIGLSDWSNFYRVCFNDNAPSIEINDIIDTDKLNLQISASGNDNNMLAATLLIDSKMRLFANRVLPLWEKGKSTPFKSPADSKLPEEGDLTLNVLENGKNQLLGAKFHFDSKPPLKAIFLYTLKKTSQLRVGMQGGGNGKARLRFIRNDGVCDFESLKDLPADSMFFDIYFDLDLKKLLPANYIVKIDHVAEDGTAAGDFWQEYQVPGKDALMMNPYKEKNIDVPLPWTPVAVNNSIVEIWGRRYDFSQGFLFSSLQSQGQELLSAPARLRIDGKDTDAKNIKVSRISTKPAQVILEKAVDLEDIKVKTELTIDFDGYCETSMTLSPVKSNVNLKTLSLDIPLQSQIATLVRDSYIFYGSKSGRLGDYWAQKLIERPVIWVGNEDIGFNWIASGLENWNAADNSKNVEIIRNGKETLLRFNLVDSPLSLKEPKTIKFGFTVTPTRPLDPKLRSARIGKEREGWINGWNKYFNYVDYKKVKLDFIDRATPGKKEGYLYLSYDFLSPYCPEWAYWEEDWKNNSRPFGSYSEDLPTSGIDQRNLSIYTTACLKSETYRNFRLNQLQSFFENAPIHPRAKHYYFDCGGFSGFEACSNPNHGCDMIWTDACGEKYHYNDLKERRDISMAIYKMIKKSDPNAEICYHLGFVRSMPSQNFTDIMVFGEGFESELANDGNYFKYFTPELFRSSLLSNTWGIKTVYIEQLTRALAMKRPDKMLKFSVNDPEIRRALLHFIGYMMVHDVEGWYDLGKTRPLVEQLWDAQDKLGWNEKTRFYPYWKNDAVKLISPQSNRIMASAYTNNGKMILAILNDTDKEEHIRLNLDLNKLGVTVGLKGYDIWQPERKYDLSEIWDDIVPPRGFRMLVFE